jgi:hypothetical protein
VTAWLLFQAASLSALVPLNCCVPTPQPQAGHTAAKCHEAPTPVDQLPSKCAMRGLCAGPEAAVATLLGSVAIPQILDALLIDNMPAGRPRAVRESSRQQSVSPDLPPPRA